MSITIFANKENITELRFIENPVFKNVIINLIFNIEIILRRWNMIYKQWCFLFKSYAMKGKANKLWTKLKYRVGKTRDTIKKKKMFSIYIKYEN